MNTTLFDGLQPDSAFFLSTDVPRGSEPSGWNKVAVSQRIDAHRNDRVGELSVLITILRFTHAHVAHGIDCSEL